MRPTQPVLPPIPSALLLPLETIPMQPTVKPQNPNFSSGPCAKRPGWTLQALKGALVGRPHRTKEGKEKLARAIDLTRDILEVQAEYRHSIVPASDTGHVEMA